MTLKKIAEKANVSISTVSRALNDSFDIAPEMRARVLEAAEECGYFKEKKRIKTANRNHEHLTVAIICPEIISPFYAQIADALTLELKKRGSRSIIFSFGFDKAFLHEIIAKCINDPLCDALICLTDSAADDFDGTSDMPIVVMGRNGECSHICADMSNYAYDAAVKCFIQNGRRKLAFAGELLTSGKEHSFTDAAKVNGVFDTEVFVSDKRFESAGCEAAEYFANLAERPNGVMCAYDEIAYGLIHRFNELDIRVPEDIAVIGMNDIQPSAYVFGGLTTLANAYGEVFGTLVEDIISDVAAGTFKKRDYPLPIRLIERKTT